MLLLLLVGLPVEAADRLGGRLGGSQVLLDGGLGLLQVHDLPRPFGLDLLILGGLPSFLPGLGFLLRLLDGGGLLLALLDGLFVYEFLHC